MALIRAATAQLWETDGTAAGTLRSAAGASADRVESG